MSCQTLLTNDGYVMTIEHIQSLIQLFDVVNTAQYERDQNMSQILELFWHLST
jgi:hypothetical protein